jgi:hypothetical protein
MVEDQRAEAQTVLDELWNEELIPFPLTVGKITQDDTEYTIHFHDSRIRTAMISVGEGQSFSERVRAAVLARVAKMSGPLPNWPLEKPTS